MQYSSVVLFWHHHPLTNIFYSCFSIRAEKSLVRNWPPWKQDGHFNSQVFWNSYYNELLKRWLGLGKRIHIFFQGHCWFSVVRKFIVLFLSGSSLEGTIALSSLSKPSGCIKSTLWLYTSNKLMTWFSFSLTVSHMLMYFVFAFYFWA